MTIEINFLTTVDESRVCLTNIPGKHGSDYINASFIDVSLLEAVVTHLYCTFRDIARKNSILQHKVSQ